MVGPIVKVTVQRDMKASDKTFKEGLAALETSLDGDFWRIFRETNHQGCEEVAVSVTEKHSVFWNNLTNWADRLSVLIEEAFERYTALAVANSQFVDGKPIEWIEARVQQFLEPRLGHKMKVAHPDPSETSEMSYAERVTGGQKAHKSITYWVAEVSEGEGPDLDHSVGEQDEQEWELDDEAVESWQAPAWLIGSTSQKDQPLEDRLDVKTTALEVGLIHFELWRKLKDAIERARLRAKVDIAASIHPAMTKRVRKKSLTEAEKVISEAIKDDRKGVRYCVYLDMNNIKPPKAWELCPQSYVKAYKSPLWRKRIQDQKSRVKRKMKT